MKIDALKIVNFRSLKDVLWQPGSLNVIIGPNGSGKSNLLKGLELVSLSAKGGLSDYVQSQGGLNSLLWDGQNRSLAFTIRGVGTRLNAAELVVYKLTLNSTHNAFTIHEGLYKPDPKRLEVIGATSNSFFTRVGSNVYLDPLGRVVGGKLTEFPPNSIKNEESALSQIANPFIVEETVVGFAHQLLDWTIYQSMDVGPNSKIRQAVVARRETRVAADGQNLVSVLHTLYSEDRDFENSINTAMRAVFGDDFDKIIFPPAADQRIQMRVRWRSLKREVSAADLSDGTLRFLFLLTVLAAPDPPPLIAIDEPEASLHPSMLPIIAEYAADASRRTQVIFTTHSDRFLDAFPAEYTPTTTVAMLQDGETTLQTLDAYALQIWLREYSLGALFRSGELESGAISSVASVGEGAAE